MNNFEKKQLKNGINVILKKEKNTPRTSFNFFVGANNELSKMAGLPSIAFRLLMQGTKTKTQEEIAQYIDFNGIEFNIEAKNDYARMAFYSLNEDFIETIYFISDLIKNSTFDEVEKECFKMKGEITADLDNPRVQTVDNLAKNVFKNHPYGNSYTVILNNLDNISKEDVKTFYNSILTPQDITLTIVGDFDESALMEALEKAFGDIVAQDSHLVDFELQALDKKEIVTISKDDAAQAQVMQGWLTESMSSEDYPALTVLNTILGAGGLSSRLFLELREKQGLAYVVRSGFDAMKMGGLFSVYIATEPKNIQVCLDGFEKELEKLKNIEVSEEELSDAKNNLVGKRQFFHETNSQKAYYLGYFECLGLGASFDKEINEKILAVTSQDIKRVANKYFVDKSVVSLLAPEKYLAEFKA